MLLPQTAGSTASERSHRQCVERCSWLPLLLFLLQRSSQEDQEELLFLPRSCSLVESRWRPGLGCPFDQHCPGRSAPARSLHICAASPVCSQPWGQHLCLKGSHSLPCLLLLCLSFPGKGGTTLRRGVRNRQSSPGTVSTFQDTLLGAPKNNTSLYLS